MSKSYFTFVYQNVTMLRYFRIGINTNNETPMTAFTIRQKFLVNRHATHTNLSISS